MAMVMVRISLVFMIVMIMSLRVKWLPLPCPVPEHSVDCSTPEKFSRYWKQQHFTHKDNSTAPTSTAPPSWSSSPSPPLSWSRNPLTWWSKAERPWCQPGKKQSAAAVSMLLKHLSSGFQGPQFWEWWAHYMRHSKHWNVLFCANALTVIYVCMSLLSNHNVYQY